MKLRAAVLLLALAPAASQTTPPPAVGAYPDKLHTLCKGYQSGPGMTQKHWDPGFESCQGISSPCANIETERSIIYVASCVDDKKCKKAYKKEDWETVTTWCQKQCEAKDSSFNTAIISTDDKRYPDEAKGMCSCGKGLTTVPWFTDEYGEYSCPYKAYEGTGKPHDNGCPAQSFDYGPDGGCGCYDDPDFDLEGPWNVDDGDLTCEMIAKNEKPLEVDDKEWQGACDQSDLADDIPGANSAFKACAQTCQHDSHNWFNRIGPEVDGCDWVAANPVGRCGKKSREGKIAHKACEKACGCRASKPFVRATWGKTGAAKETALELFAKGELADDEVPVRVPTIVALCVMVGVALGGLGTLLFTKAKTPKPHEAQPLIALEKA